MSKMLYSLQYFLIESTWSYTLKIAVLLNLPIVPKCLPLKYPEQILVKLLNGVIRRVNMTLEPFELLSPPFYHFQQFSPVILDRVNNFYRVVNQLLLEYFVDQKVLLERGGGVHFDQPTFQLRIYHDVISKQLEAVWIVGDVFHAGD